MIDHDTHDGAVSPTKPDDTHSSKLEARQLWEAEERIAELEGRLAEGVERQRVLEVELAALRSDLLVKVAYSAALEQAATERQGHIHWLQSHFDAEKQYAGALAAELAAERGRISYRVIQRLIPLVRVRRPHP